LSKLSIYGAMVLVAIAAVSYFTHGPPEPMVSSDERERDECREAVAAYNSQGLKGRSPEVERICHIVEIGPGLTDEEVVGRLKNLSAP
jgi:hypothetical protein